MTKNALAENLVINGHIVRRPSPTLRKAVNRQKSPSLQKHEQIGRRLSCVEMNLPLHQSQIVKNGFIKAKIYVVGSISLLDNFRHTRRFLQYFSKKKPDKHGGKVCMLLRSVNVSSWVKEERSSRYLLYLLNLFLVKGTESRRQKNKLGLKTLICHQRANPGGLLK